ncbi:MAG TPA: 3-dehydroquinate synthase family protein [Holophagaceae bacterium]|nr:3-dehydroquinate synthase family protein [Holophagaceae bacterium]
MNPTPAGKLMGPMRLATPPAFPTEVFVLEAPDPSLLPEGPWVLVGDEALRAAWRAAKLPEPTETRWVSVDEPRKRLETIIPWLEAWSRVPLHRDGTVVAVGGGVLTDLAGLAAALYLRGIAWQTWPSTLLSMADAGLGGKTGADLPTGKNLVGAFHAPRRLVACLDFLATLPQRQVDSGRWELVKTALLKADLAWAQELFAQDAPRRVSVERALAYKAEVVHRDPTEQGERRLLNLGHTLGHAVESASDYRILHGEAVGVGLLASCLLSAELGFAAFPESFIDAMAQRLRPLAPLLPAWEDALPWMRRDKKATSLRAGGPAEIHCILPRPDGPPQQRLLPPEAWAEPFARCLHLITGETSRA